MIQFLLLLLIPQQRYLVLLAYLLRAHLNLLLHLLDLLVERNKVLELPERLIYLVLVLDSFLNFFKALLLLNLPILHLLHLPLRRLQLRPQLLYLLLVLAALLPHLKDLLHFKLQVLQVLIDVRVLLDLLLQALCQLPIFILLFLDFATLALTLIDLRRQLVNICFDLSNQLLYLTCKH